MAQRHETFAEKPNKRIQRADDARIRADRDKRSAREWARAHGVKMRRQNGLKVIELMAVRDGRPVYYSTKNYNAAVSTGAHQVRNTAPFAVDGSNVTVGIWDGGSVLSSHVEFASGRANGQRWLN